MATTITKTLNDFSYKKAYSSTRLSKKWHEGMHLSAIFDNSVNHTKFCLYSNNDDHDDKLFGKKK